MPPMSKDLGVDVTALTGVTQDSRKVKEGYLFAALQGVGSDGRDYIPQAVLAGASVILTDNTVALELAQGKQLVTSDNPRKSFAHIVSEFYDAQPSRIVAVTGTNGKSSVVHFANQLWRAINEKSAYIGTLSGGMTTPDPVALHELLAEHKEEGVTHLALEASSHGLEQYRMDGVHVDVAAFTSFSQDHLDYHADMEDYLSAKARLFSELLEEGGTAVLNADIPEYTALTEVCAQRGVNVISYGKNGHELKLLSREIDGVSQKIEINLFGRDYSLTLPLVGEFQVMNVLCALGCVLSEYSADEDKISAVLSAVENLQGVPGRLQHVVSEDGSHNAYIDYAHTPDALENVLKALRPHTRGRLICMFGCGGDRDKAKRPLMGMAAANGADVVVVTDDNPRSENPVDIRKQILDPISPNAVKLYEVNERRSAIEFSVRQLQPNDILLVAGKGHEQGQIFDGFIEPFDDVCEVETALRKKEVLND